MRIALVAPPFIPVPPREYGGTELFIAHLAEGLQKLGHQPVVYSNGESTVAVEKRWLYPHSQWPIQGEIYDNLKDLNHTAWAVRDAVGSCDIIHLNNASGLVCSRFVPVPFVYTLHHPHEKGLSDFYANFPKVQFVTISNFQQKLETMPRIRTIYHGLDLSPYGGRLDGERKYLAFLGRIAPMKGTHIAIEVAQKSGIPLKIAGEVQPKYRDYFEQQIKPHLSDHIEYIGEVNLEEKADLLMGARALLFPIQWNEPFGLVMIEAMACGAPTLALPGGAVEEVVRDGVSGYVCHSAEEMVQRAQSLSLDPEGVRAYVRENFSPEKMARSYADLYGQVIAGENLPVKEREDKRSVA
jgi:glycosyltransferase involved in cell wall biosynthesis